MADRHGQHGLGDDPAIARAWEFVIEHQGKQNRKASGSAGAPVLYTNHLRGVAKRVQDDGGTNDEIIGALLHDVVEDTPVNGGRSIEIPEVQEVFGDRAAEIVKFCTDTKPGTGEGKEPWRKRKEAHFAHVRGADRGTLRVVAADKTDNITGQVRSLEECNGDAAARAEALTPPSTTARPPGGRTESWNASRLPCGNATTVSSHDGTASRRHSLTTTWSRNDLSHLHP